VGEVGDDTVGGPAEIHVTCHRLTKLHYPGAATRRSSIRMTTRNELIDRFDGAFSPDRAHDFAAQLTDYYRSPGSSGFLEAMEIVTDELSEMAFDELEVAAEPISNAWEPNAAELWIDGNDRTKLVDFEDAPSCLPWYSTSTPPEGETVEVVDVGTGESPADFEGVDVEGKAVFVHGTERRPGWWKAAELAAERGARGIVTDYLLYQTPGVRTPELVPDATQLLRLRPPDYFVDGDMWAFSITHGAGEKLSERLQTEETVTLEAFVDADTFESELRTVEATIEGTEEPDERVLFCAHASGIEPGANCAEGTGATVETARALTSLIDDGDLPQPKRSITFIVGCEGPVSEQYLEHNPDADEAVQAALNYCSAGHKQSETKSTLLVSQSPDSVPSYLNDYLADVMDAVPKEADWIGKEGGQELPLLSMTQHYYTPWSDNTRLAAAGIPTALFMSWPDRHFHSQFLTEEVIDPAALRRSSVVSGVAAFEIADAGSDRAAAIARTVAGRSVERLTAAGATHAGDGVDDPDEAHSRLDRLAERDIANLRSVLGLAPDSERVETLVGDLQADLEAAAERERAALPDAESDGTEQSDVTARTPVRTAEQAARWDGLDYEDLQALADDLAAADDEAGWRSLRIVCDEVWNFVDGERTVGDIATAVSVEYDLTIEPEPVHRILEGHAESGNLELQG
jgi:hypothetical protein